MQIMFQKQTDLGLSFCTFWDVIATAFHTKGLSWCSVNIFHESQKTKSRLIWVRRQKGVLHGGYLAVGINQVSQRKLGQVSDKRSSGFVVAFVHVKA